MIPLYIFDLDGTLALIDHRRHLVEKRLCQTCGGLVITHPPTPPCSTCKGTGYSEPDWPAFFRACVDDLPNTPVIRTMHALSQRGADCWIFSGRSDEVVEETLEWLRTHVLCGLRDAGRTFRANMRPAGDYTPDEVLKRQWLHQLHPADRRRLVAVFDDRDKVVAMWRSEGVACFQVAPGEF